MERAGTGERIDGVVMRDEDVAELGMHEPVDGSAIEDDAGTDARAHRHVDEVRQPPSDAPALLGKRCRVHIGVEGNGDVELLAERADDVGVAPTRFRGLCDPAERLRSDAHIDGPEGADAEGGNADTVALEELDDATQRLGWRRRRDDLDLGEIAWAGALGAHPLRSTGLDAPEHGWIGCAGAQSGSRGSVSVLIALAGVWIAQEARSRGAGTYTWPGVGRRLGSNSLSVFCWMDAARASPMMVASAVNDVKTSAPSQMRETVKLATGLDSMITAAFR